MSTEEKKRREQYKRKRNLWILLQSIFIVIVSSLLLVSLISYNRYSNDYYIQYEESSNVDFKVYLKDNSFYDTEYLPSGQSYIGEIIDYLSIDFNYDLVSEANANYEYEMKTEAYLEIVSGTNGSAKLLFKHFNELEPINSNNKTAFQYGDDLHFKENVEIDYDYYNDMAKEYLRTYNPTNATSTLVINFYMDTDVSFIDYSKEDSNNATLSLRVPLAVTNVTPEVRGLASSNQLNSVLIYSDQAHQILYKNISIISAIVDAVLIVVLVVYIYLSKNHDINYSNKVKRIVKVYKSFIQKILNMLDITSYQVIYLESIKELLEIRDTLQMPILMYENEDKTCTKFMLPTNNEVLYMYEIKVDNYDELYNDIKEENIKEENLEEAVEVTSDGKIVRYNYSFESKLILSKQEYKDFYLKIVGFAKAYGLSVNRSWDRERIYLGRKLFASLQFRGKTLCVGFPVDPKDETYSKYRFVDMSEVKRYQAYPAVLRVSSDRKTKYVIEVLGRLLEENNIPNKNLTIKNEKIKTKSKNTLIKEGLIKL